jgi:hypothetical protein
MGVARSLGGPRLAEERTARRGAPSRSVAAARASPSAPARRQPEAPEPARPSQVGFTLIVDDTVHPDGATSMEQVGGGGAGPPAGRPCSRAPADRAGCGGGGGRRGTRPTRRRRLNPIPRRPAGQAPFPPPRRPSDPLGLPAAPRRRRARGPRGGRRAGPARQREGAHGGRSCRPGGVWSGHWHTQAARAGAWALGRLLGQEGGAPLPRQPGQRVPLRCMQQRREVQPPPG